MTQRVLQLIAIGTPPPLGILRDLEEPLRAQLGLVPVPGKTQLPQPAYAFNKDRNQFHSNAVMRRLTPLLEGPAQLGLGVLDVDLFVPDAPFVFGEADREARIALLSLFRLRQGADPDTFRRRAQVEAVHQAGHLLGLSYCEDARCVMYLAAQVSDCDRKGLALCNLCRNELGKLSR